MSTSPNPYNGNGTPAKDYTSSGRGTASPVAHAPQLPANNQHHGSTGTAGIAGHGMTGSGFVSGMMRQVPVQQHFSGPASTFINVFQQPGDYRINVNFRPEFHPDGARLMFNGSQPSQGYNHNSRFNKTQ